MGLIFLTNQTIIALFSPNLSYCTHWLLLKEAGKVKMSQPCAVWDPLGPHLGAKVHAAVKWGHWGTLLTHDTKGEIVCSSLDM